MIAAIKQEIKTKVKILVVDNYDSFTYNLVHCFREMDADVVVKRNDEVNNEQVKEFKKIVLSPGPGLPSEAGRMPEVIRDFYATHSILGICLGHQAIGEFFGAQLQNLEEVYHGVETEIKISEKNHFLFHNVPTVFKAGRYHSWCISNKHIPDELKVTARDEKGIIMAVSHRKFDVHGLQFHPESIMTEHGKTILKNFIHHSL
ncbi:MAG: anthranilate synthase component II [Bacteroidota bacterium]